MTNSILRAIISLVWGISAVGSAPHWQCGGHGFKSRMLHRYKPCIYRAYFFCVIFRVILLFSALVVPDVFAFDKTALLLYNILNKAAGR